MFNKILVAFDGSEHSIKALRMAADLSRKYNAYLSVANAVNLPELPDRGGFKEARSRGFTPELERAAAIAAEEQVVVVTHLLRGNPANTLQRFAEENHFDLVVIGARGHNAVKRFLMGSVSTHLVNNLCCPVLVVKERSA